MSETTAYDRVLYPGHPFGDTHPDHLAVLAGLHGMQPVPPAKCRVLELGCGDGGNLIPMALQYPESEFVGIDLSGRSIAIGKAAIAALGLTNITLAVRDIMDVSAADGAFDYIIAHGVYSWVPPAVRAKVLAIFARNLSAHGIAYVSYNAFPGAHLRDLVRSIMHFHVRAVEEPNARVAQSRMLLKFLGEVSAEDQPYGLVLRDQENRIRTTPDQVLVHDDLDEGSSAFFLYQVVEAAAESGLQYLADADVSEAHEYRRLPQVRAMLANIPEREAVTREQYLDFICGRVFRKSLFCRHDVTLRRPVAADAVAGHYVAAMSMPATADVDVSQPGVVEFKGEGGGRIATDHALSKAALLLLGRAWPQAIEFGELVARACALLPTPAGGAAREANEVSALQDVLLQAFWSGQVRLHCGPLPLTTVLSERPVANPLARLQAREQGLVTSLRHGLVMLEDDTARRFLQLVDGTRDIAALQADLAAVSTAEVRHEDVMRNLKVLARLGLLVS
jgi:SAM-dependent methyltransferase